MAKPKNQTEQVQKLDKKFPTQEELDSIISNIAGLLVKKDRLAIQPYINSLYELLDLEPVEFTTDKRVSNGGRTPRTFYGKWTLEGKEVYGSLQELSIAVNRSIQTLYRLRNIAIAREEPFFWTTDGITKDVVIFTSFENDDELEQRKQTIREYIAEQRKGNSMVVDGHY